MIVPPCLRLALACQVFVSGALLAEKSVEPTNTYDLRVFGRLAAGDIGEGSGVWVEAESPEKARITYSKFLSDFTTLPTVRLEKIPFQGGQVDVLVFDGGRRLLPVLKKGASRLAVYSFETQDALTGFLKTSPDEVAGATTSSLREHPLFTDLWDRRNMGFWYSLGFKVITKDRTDDQDFEFMRERQLNVNTVGGGVPAVAQRADRDDLGYKTNRWYDVSTYAYDAHPEASTKSDPDLTHYPHYYGDVPLADNPIRRGQVAELLSYLGQFTHDDHLMTITDAYGETAAHTHYSYPGFSDRDEYSRRDFIHYLRDIRKLGLQELGERWYGDAKYFNSWDDVQFPREREFYGWEDGQSQDLGGEWKWRLTDRETGEKDKFFSPSFDDSSWFTYRQPGTQYLAGGVKDGAWMRHTFVPDTALLKAGKPIYLTVAPLNDASPKNPSTVYLNGEKVADIDFTNGADWAQVDVSKFLKTGDNTLAVYTPRGNIGGPVFLSLRQVEDGYPTSDPHLNARNFDLREWVADACARAVALSVKRLRGIDSERGVKLMAPHDNVDIIMPYMQEWGMYPHCTGQGAYFRPWLRRNGYLFGIMGSSEPSASAKDLKDLKRIFFTLTFEGMGAHDYFYNLHDVLVSPEKKDWYEKNLPYYKLNGRFDLRKPEVAIAWSLRAARYDVKDGDCYRNDPGRGDLQQAKHTFVYCSEKDLLAGRADDYRVIIDDNFNTLSDEEVKALQSWVEKGGTLVLNQRSGRNSILKKDAFPLADLVGCDYSIRPQEGNVTFEKNPSLLKAYAGQTFKNFGAPVDYRGRSYFHDSVALKPRDASVEVIARYDDGAPAIISRSLGKGRVIVLGSAFYRDSTDLKGFWVGAPRQTAFYKNLLADLGIAPVVESNDETLWAERFVSNNGSTDLLVLGNQSDTEDLKNASATWDVGFTPRRVFDPATGKDVPVKIEGSKVKIDNVNLGPYEMSYYAVEKTDLPAAETVSHWLGRQSQLWRALPAGEPPSPVDPSWPIFFLGNYEVKQFPTEVEAVAAMAPDYKISADWKSLPPADWASAGLQRSPDLWATYRKTFDVSPDWLADLRGVELVRTAVRSLWGNLRRVTVNGLVIFENGRNVNEDKILAALKPGSNDLAILTSGDKDGNGGFFGEIGLRRIPGASGEIVSLQEGWTAYPSDTESVTVSFPAKGQWLLARKQVSIPEKYKDHQVWLEVDGASTAATNGRVRYASNNYGAKISPRPYLVNITPDVKFGQENEIAIADGNWRDGIRIGKMDIQSAKLILVPPGSKSSTP